MKKYFSFQLLLSVAITLISNFSLAQATRTWVSGVGDDVNPGSRTAPCKTFAGAISKTATGGEINVIDAGGFGAVTITKSITIDGGGAFAAILSSGTTGIIINAGSDGVVTLRHLNINGAGTGITGIKILSAKKVQVEDCNLSNFTQKGIEVSITSSCIVVINNTTIYNAVDAIAITNPAGSVTIDGCRFQTVDNAGVNLLAGQATISNSNISGCGTGISAAAKTTARISNNVISNNGTGLVATGTIASAGNNLITGNKVHGTPNADIKLL